MQNPSIAQIGFEQLRPSCPAAHVKRQAWL